MTYRYPMQAGPPPPPRGESPISQHHNIAYPSHPDQYIHTPQQSLYNNPNANTSTDFSPFPDSDPQSAGPYDGGPYRNNSVFGGFFPVRQRQSVAGPSSANYGNDQNGVGFSQYGPSAAEMFGTHQPLPLSIQQQQQLNGVRGYDFSNDIHTLKPNGKPIFTNMDPFGTGSAAANAAMLQSHQLNKVMNAQQQQQIANLQNQPFANGSLQSQSQTPFGPHLTTNGSSMGGSVLNHSNSVGNISVTNQQEEISTIFVVGFPDDMQEREFQNMFTFSSGFEAATLKIPNKDSTAYSTNAPQSSGTGTANARGSYQLGYSYSGANDPYNLVTANSGGVVVDGRDGTTVSWPSNIDTDLAPGFGSAGGAQGSGPVPPRKQIIGFAKFRTRADALAARDLLQGRRVDIEKGAVLKAEMAKKNLHTKRGVGPLGVPLSVSSNVGSTGMNAGVSGGMHSAGGLSSISEGLAGMMSPAAGPGEIIVTRELGALSGIGIGSLRRDRLESQDEERERELRRRRELGSVNSLASGFGSFSMLSSRGPRERLEEDERERERRRREKEAERNGRLRSGNQAAYDAFHSVNVPLRNSSVASTVLSPSENVGAYPFSNSQAFSPQDCIGNNLDGWPGQRKAGSIGANGAFRSLPIGIPSNASNVPTRPPSSHDSSPSEVNTDPAFPASLSSQSGVSDNAPSDSEAYAQANHMTLSSHPSMSSLGSRSRPYSPTNEATLPSSGFFPPQPEQQTAGFLQAHGSQIIATSSSSSVSGSRSSTSSNEDEMSRAIGNIDIGSQQGTISPQLPSPNSGASSGTGSKTNASDQNPPINTLYVGNLPTSPVPGNQPNLLEEHLRSLFQRSPGYRKLCFRQKANGPMCFVEFEDVAYATKALNDLYGHQLGGLVKGGIRLSFSKNPLGVRTPTNGVNGSGLQQQQMQQGLQSFVSTPSLPYMRDSFSQRQSNGGILAVDMSAIRGARRDQAEIMSPSYHFAASPPPPRFISPPPQSYGFSTQPGTTGLTRSSSQGFRSFSPFGSSTPPIMTPQFGPSDSADTSQPTPNL